MKGSNSMHCYQCNKEMVTSKTMVIYHANRVLIIGLKRFHNHEKNYRKIKIPEDLEAEFLMVTYEEHPQLVCNSLLR